MNIERRGISVACRVDTSRLATKILWFCLLCEIAFVILDYHVNYGRWTEIGAMRRMFNTAREDGLASWFAVTQTPLVSLTLWFIYALAKRGHQPRLKVVGWLVLALFFTYMAFDDGVQMHERLGSTFNTVRERSGGSLDFFPSYTWQILFLPGFALLGGFTLCFLWLELHGRSVARSSRARHLAPRVRRGLDFIEGLDDDHPWNAYTWVSERFELETWTRARFGRSDFDTLQHFSKSFEETMEMVANSILWFLFLRHIPAVASDFHVRLHSGE